MDGIEGIESDVEIILWPNPLKHTHTHTNLSRHRNIGIIGSLTVSHPSILLESLVIDVHKIIIKRDGMNEKVCW